MTGPALLIGLVSVLVTTFMRGNTYGGLGIASAIVLWLLAVALVFAAGAAHRTGSFTKTLRAMGFGHSVYLLAVFTLLPVFGPAVNLAILAQGFIAVW